jgi:hypothetical protein
MKKKIYELLLLSPNLTGREIAKKIGEERSAVNLFLSQNHDSFSKNDTYQWSVKSLKKVVIEFDPIWIDSQAFETCLSRFPDLFADTSATIEFIFPKKCKFLLIAIAKLLALTNQLVHKNISILIDMKKCGNTRSYFDRAGFFDHLDKRIVVLPSRPTDSLAQKQKGNSESLVEFGSIDPNADNKEIKVQLGNTFIMQSNERYRAAAFTTFAELIGNVSEHSQSDIVGFAALQGYEPSHKSKHIQTVISDSGLGISSTLRPTLEKNHPKLHKKYKENTIDSDVGLVKESFLKGGISRLGKGRGLGFKSSREQSAKFDAIFSIRQETFNLEFIYRSGVLIKTNIEKNLSKIHGTHICFDFNVD